MVTTQQGLQENGLRVSMAKLCRWFGRPRRSMYYEPAKATPKVREELATSVKALIEEEPSLGYRAVAGLLDMNKNTVQPLPAQRLAGAQASRGLPPAGPVVAAGAGAG